MIIGMLMECSLVHATRIVRWADYLVRKLLIVMLLYEQQGLWIF
jgi:hypothetical protein